MDRLALTDTNGLYGLIFFLQAAKEAGIRPIVGVEVRASVRGQCFWRRTDEATEVFAVSSVVDTLSLLLGCTLSSSRIARTT